MKSFLSLIKPFLSASGDPVNQWVTSPTNKTNTYKFHKFVLRLKKAFKVFCHKHTEQSAERKKNNKAKGNNLENPMYCTLTLFILIYYIIIQSITVYHSDSSQVQRLFLPIAKSTIQTHEVD